MPIENDLVIDMMTSPADPQTSRLVVISSYGKSKHTARLSRQNEYLVKLLHWNPDMPASERDPIRTKTFIKQVTFSLSSLYWSGIHRSVIACRSQ